MIIIRPVLISIRNAIVLMTGYSFELVYKKFFINKIHYLLFGKDVAYVHMYMILI